MVVTKFSRILLMGLLIIVGLTSISPSYAEDANKKTSVIIDTDMGVDDFMALIWLLNREQLDIKAITISTDGLSLSPYGAENAALLVKLVNGDSSIQVYNGNELAKPEKGFDRNFPIAPREEASKLVRTVNGIKDIKDYAYNKEATAPEAMYKLALEASKNNQGLVILSIGTATNIAEAYDIAVKNDKAKEFVAGIKMVYKAGGAFGLEAADGKKRITNLNIPGNLNIGGIYGTNNNTAEWNIYAAAESMQKILESGLPVTFIPVNVSNAVKITSDSNQRLRKEGGKLGNIVADITYDVWVKNQGGWSVATLSYWDPSAVVPILYPEMIQKENVYQSNVCVQVKNPKFSVGGMVESFTPEGAMDYKTFDVINDKSTNLYYASTLVGDESYCQSVASAKSVEATILMGIDPDGFYDSFIKGFRQESDQ